MTYCNIEVTGKQRHQQNLKQNTERQTGKENTKSKNSKNYKGGMK